MVSFGLALFAGPAVLLKQTNREATQKPEPTIVQDRVTLHFMISQFRLIALNVVLRIGNTHGHRIRKQQKMTDSAVFTVKAQDATKLNP